MIPRPRQVVVLGSTGSIGRSTLDVVAALQDRAKIVALSANRNLAMLVEQARAVRPRWVVAADPAVAAQTDWSGLPPETELLVGPEGLQRVAADAEVDVVVAAIVGSAGLRSVWAALEAGKTVALANKETLVAAGPLVMRLVKQHGGCLLPVDSEHSAVFQALQSGRRADVARIVLTASGGPFVRFTAEQLANVTVEQALRHPTWEMGPKITVDSATMMNKALEIIEARWLFDLTPEQIDVVVHPQSVVHSFVEFRDGSVLAQLSPPDMRLPIQLALTWPERQPCPAPRMDFSRAFGLAFEPPDHERFPALGLGWDVARAGGTAGAVVNAANEVAVAAFLEGRLPFVRIVPACRAVLEHHDFETDPTLDRLWQLDAWARKEVCRWMDC